MAGHKKVLVAEDDTGITDVINLILTEAGYEILSTSDGKNIFKLLEVRPHVVLLDVRLSGVDGREVCKKIKASRKFSDIPVILFSADPNIEMIARQAGADAFIRKPFDMDELLVLSDRTVS